MPITTIISDIGGVVAAFDNERTVAALSPHAGVPPAAIRSALFGPGALMRRYAGGELDTDAFRRTLRTTFVLRPTLQDALIDRAVADVFRRNEEVIALWRTLRAEGAVVTALSDVEEVRHRELERIGVMDLFDHEVLSYLEGMTKPSEELLVRALDRSGADAGEAFYVDDLEENLVPARRLGIATHRFLGPEGLYRALTDAGIALP